MASMNCHAYAAIDTGTLAMNIFDQRRKTQTLHRARGKQKPRAQEPGVSAT